MCDQRSAHVTRKEEQVPALQSPANQRTHARLIDGAPRQVDAGFPMDILGQSRAVEGAGTLGAPDVRTADQTGRQFDGILCEQRNWEGKDTRISRTQLVKPR